MTDIRLFYAISLCSRNLQIVRNAFIFFQISFKKLFFNIS